ncbi:MAG: hypothetical protein PHD74_04140, partial [Candidatus Krumholzibacteria bacterium]|nr:hypothetical protein [Candidatus Krumholzibacteria bacterium]
MFRKLVFAATLLAAAAPTLAQSPFEEIHGDVLSKMELMRARKSSAATPLLAPQPTSNQLLYDVLHYTIDVAIDPTAKVIEGSVTVRITPISGTLDSMEIDADDALTISLVRVAAGDTLAWVRSTGLLTVKFPAVISPGDTIDVEILYGGSPSSSSDPGLFFSSAAGYPLIYS